MHYASGKESPVNPKQQKKERKLFKTGESGNLKGRPVGTSNTKDILAQAFQSMTKEVRTPDGEVRKMNGREQMLYNWAKRALKSDRATEAILNRIDGMPVQTTIIGSGGGLNIDVTYQKPKEADATVEIRPEKVPIENQKP